jgi:hypothetical protein
VEKALEPDRARSVDQEDAVEAIGHPLLEEERNVANDDSVAARARLVDEVVAQALDLGVHDLVKFFELGLVGKDDATQGGAVEVTVGGKHRVPPPPHDFGVCGGSEFDGAPGKNIGVDDRCAAFGQHAGDRRFTASDVAGEANK